MALVWWVLPAISGVVGLMLCLAGTGKLFQFKPLSGLSRLVFGSGFMGLGGVVALAGLNLQTFNRLTFERPVATISFDATERPDVFQAKLLYPGGDEATYEMRGDEWELNARVVKFKALSNVLGFDSVYKLDRFYGRFENVDRANETNGVRLSQDPGLDVFAMAQARGGMFGVTDANYGSGVYNPMAAGLAYEVTMGQSGLIARAANAATRELLGDPQGAIGEQTEG